MPEKTIAINRAPALTLWAAVVAEELGSDAPELQAGRSGEDDRVWFVVADS